MTQFKRQPSCTTLRSMLAGSWPQWACKRLFTPRQSGWRLPAEVVGALRIVASTGSCLRRSPGRTSRLSARAACRVNHTGGLVCPLLELGPARSVWRGAQARGAIGMPGAGVLSLAGTLASARNSAFARGGIGRGRSKPESTRREGGGVHAVRQSTGRRPFMSSVRCRTQAATGRSPCSLGRGRTRCAHCRPHRSAPPPPCPAPRRPPWPWPWPPPPP